MKHLARTFRVAVWQAVFITVSLGLFALAGIVAMKIFSLDPLFGGTIIGVAFIMCFLRAWRR